MWLLMALLAYLINAGVYVADKFLLSKKVHSSIAYAFYVGLWSFLNIVLLFLDPWFPGFKELLLDLSSGLLFLVTLIFWYKALHQSEATRVVPIVGALVPVFTFILSSIFLGEELSERQFLAFAILIIGGVLISVKHTKFYEARMVMDRFRQIFGNALGGIHASYRPTRRLIINSVVSGFFFAAYYVLAKHIYSTQPFIGGFVWSRMGSFLGVIIIFCVPAWHRLVNQKSHEVTRSRNWFLFFTTRALAAGAFILLNYAISLGNVALINSLQGAQYIFLFVMVLFLSSRFPKILKEEMGGDVIFQKVMGGLLVGIGLYMLI